VLGRHVKRNAILNMELPAEGSPEHRPVMIKDVQKEFVSDKVLHIDFLQVSMTRMIEVEIPIHLIGESIGVTKEGIVEQHLRSIRIECLPTQIPEALEVDVTALDIGDSFHVSQVSLPGVKLLEGPDVAIVTIAHGGIEEQPVETVEAEAPAEG
jgi:large subunit ribosomal protein L25